MKVNPEQFYSQLEVQKITGIKSRQYLTKYINNGTLLAIQTGTGGPRLRYAIKGSWLIDFMDRYKKGLVKGKRYEKEEVKKLLEAAIKDLR